MVMKLASTLLRKAKGRGHADTDAAIADTTLHGHGPDTIPVPAARAPTPAFGAGHHNAGTARRAEPMLAQPRQTLATQLPWIGGLPFRKQLRVLVPTLAVSLLLAFAFLWMDARQAANDALLVQIVGDALTHSQRLAKVAPGAVAGSDDAFRQLRDSRDALGLAVAMLQGAENPATGRSAMAPSAARDDIRVLQKTWAASDASAARLIELEKLLSAVGAMRHAVNESDRSMFENARTVVLHRLQANAGVRDVSAAGDMVTLTQRIAKDVNRLLTGESLDADAAASLGSDTVSLREIADGLATGSGRLKLGAAQDADSQRALGEIRRTLARVEPMLLSVAREVPRIQQAKAAELEILKDSETVRGHLEAIRRALSSADSGIGWKLWIVIVCSLVAVLGAVGLAQAYLGDSRRRTFEAERQRREAERLEKEAKRTNDQNQAAILRLMNELQEVADGDLTIQATVSEDITGAIADSVNYTVEELRSLVARINATAVMVNDASGKAQSVASVLQTASEQQSREIRDTGEAVLRMAHQINEVSARASESANVARRSLSASEGGSRAVQNAIAGMDGIRDQIQETAKRIKRLGESSQEIGEIVELISDITEQTNVLALNAAIQAASAGEAGRGFTVVAEEVQRLAERSGEATKQIAALIRAIQTDTQDAVAAMERSTQGVVEGTKLSDEAGRALGEIGLVSRQLAELIEDFSQTTSRQASSAATVAQSIQRILLVTEQTSDGTRQTAGSIRKLSTLAQELKSSVSRFKVA